MKSKDPLKQQQGNFLYQDLLDQLNPKHPLLLLAKRIPWEFFEEEFKPLYVEIGRPAKPIMRRTPKSCPIIPMIHFTMSC